MKEYINVDYYEPRYISQTNNSLANSWFNGSKKSNILKEVIFDKDKIVLLGNPGIGKSKELERLFADLWKEKDKNGLIPFSISLKNFRKSNKFEDLIIYPEWKSLSSIIFILDGLDEIAEIQDFISAFEVFISQNKLLNIKYVISCRTNIYEKFLVNIPNFDTFYLDDLVYEQSKSLLKNKYVIDVDIFQLEEKHLNYLKTPFFLDLFASYILEKKILPRTDSEMWELFVKKTLDIHTQKQLKKKLVDRPKLIHNLKKVSFVNELMQKNFSSQEELLAILKENHHDFIENPFFVELDKPSGKWNFEHRQIQEYFVAKTLSERTIEEILSIIKIPHINIEVIHPSLFNTISFLINLLEKDSDTFVDLIDWIKSNQIELLFKADSNRTQKFKVEVFKYYFKTQCIDKKLWISTNKTFSVKEIAEFGNCKDNFNYLIDFVNDEDSHIRVVLSAIKLLCFFEIPKGNEEEVKIWCLDLIKKIDNEVSVKSSIIQFITAQNLILNDPAYLNSIFDALKAETNKEINSSLLFMIRDIDNLDSLFWYLKEEFLRVNKIVKRNDIDDVHRGNSWVLNELIFKLNDSNSFIELISYHFMIGFNLDLSNDDAEKILNKCLFFSGKEDDFMVRFLTAINGKTEFYKNERLLKAIITESASQLKASKYLLENNPFSIVRLFLANIANTNVIELVREYFVLCSISSEEINIFRHNLWVFNKDQSYKFDLLMSSQPVNFKFDNPLLSEEQLLIKQKENNSKFQHNFDILFNKDELLREIEIIFKENSPVIDQNEIGKIESNWYRKNGSWSNTIDTSIQLLRRLVYYYEGTLSFVEVQKIFEKDFIRYDKIKTLIQGNVNSNVKFVISDQQKSSIIDWCIETSKSIDFDMIIKLDGVNSFTMLRDYEVLKTVLIFQDMYEFELSIDFLLNCLEFIDIEKTSETEEDFDKILARIGDKTLFDQQIVDNLLSKEMFSTVIDRHVKYALRHNLKQTFPRIRTYFIESVPGYNLDKVLEEYIDLTGDIELLKECCEDSKTPKCWLAIKILLKLEKEVDFCISKAIEYIECDREDTNKFYLWDALGVLFQQNRKEAIFYYYSFLNVDYVSRMNYSNYSAIDYDTFEKIFFKTYGKDSEKSSFNDSAEFMSSYINNLSKDDESYSKTQIVLNSIKSKLNEEEQDSALFYINILIDNSTTSYINSKSKPMKFKEALLRVEEIIN
ncbi:MAG: NACHT domain-containing protein [Candidatus Sericytochromatia bacterium]